MMYSTATIAEFLGIPRQNINSYIRNGFLIALLVDGSYRITHEDYIFFKEEYYESNNRNSNKGTAKKLCEEQIKIISNIVSDSLNDELQFSSFVDKFKDFKNYIPNYKEYMTFKRDKCIKYDRANKNNSYKTIAFNYGLSVRTIETIVNQDEQKMQF